MRNDLLQRFLTGDSEALAELLAAPLDAVSAAAAAEQLKAEADRHWTIDANRSLALAEAIIAIGRHAHSPGVTALGLMARGDAVKLLGRIEEAWDTLGQAGQMFIEAGDEIGWARTRIGRLYISADLKRVDEALADAAEAREIFTRHNDVDRLLRLDLNTAIVHDLLGEHRRALSMYQSAHRTAESMGEAGTPYLPYIFTNMGYAHTFLAAFDEALRCHERAYDHLLARGERTGAAVAELNIAYIAQAQGHYRHALRLLHHVLDLAPGELPVQHTLARREMVECYLALNRSRQARDLACEVIEAYRQQNADLGLARTLLHLATAEAALGNDTAALAALEEAEPLYTALGASAWTATVHLRRGRIALRQGDHQAAARAAQTAAASLNPDEHRITFAETTLLAAQAAFAAGSLDAAAEQAARAARLAQQCHMPALRYSAHLLQGHIAACRQRSLRAARHYQAAAATVERLQRRLTVTLRPGFLEDKGEALRALIHMYLHAGQPASAFETLEKAKSQVLLGHLVNREAMRWATDTPEARQMVEELDQLRARHHWYYRMVYEPAAADEAGQPAPRLTPQQALAELTACERRMRALTERLYLLSDPAAAERSEPTIALADIQAAISPDAVLVEYYNDGEHLWAFTLDARGLQVHPLGIAPEALNSLIEKLQLYIDRALRAGRAAPVTQTLHGHTLTVLQRLHAALIAPLAAALAGRSRVVIVPYGVLHYLPFNLLHDGQQYLIQQRELATLPAAGLATQRSPHRAAGALALAHSHGGLFPNTQAEAQSVFDLFGGQLCVEDSANRRSLAAPPRQILHIAAHGKYRIDQPDFSYIQLADGQLFTDDLLQNDLSFELVTLSACETGRARVAPGDELIGLGHSFLYAGAGALIASLWRVDDDIALQTMRQVYGALRRGASKAAALRAAQCELLACAPHLHPAFWGAFQLIGNPDPLTAQDSGGFQQEELTNVQTAVG